MPRLLISPFPPLIRAALGLALSAGFAAPALADRMMLEMVTRGVAVGNQPLARGYAACLLGEGTVDGVEAALAEMDFTRADDAELGMVTFTSPSLPFSVTLHDNGAICDVTSETLGTDQATMGIVIVGGMAGYEIDNGGACARMRIAGTALAEITSSGNDPQCSSAGTSNVRFTFGAAAPAPATPAPTK